jgi:integrase
MASIKPHGTGWRVQVYVKGVRDSSIHRTKREATAWGAARELELRTDSEKVEGDKHTLADALVKYRDEISPLKRGQRWEEVRIASFLRDKGLPTREKLGNIGTPHIGKWRDSRLESVQPGTVLRELGLLSAVFEAARRDWNWVKENPVSDVRKPREPDHRKVVITRTQIKLMLREMGYSPRLPIRTVSQSVAMCFLLALRTGMRAGELCALTWDRVFDGYCSTPHKSGRTDVSLRDVPLTRKAEALIEKMKGWDSKLVFGLKSQSLDALFRKYRQRAGLEGFTFHDSRHTAATWIAGRMRSNNISAQQAVLDMCKTFGWTKVDQALTYYNPSAADIAKRIG